MDKAAIARARSALYRSLRAYFEAEGFDEVETPCLVPAPGMEPHIAAFEVPFVPEMGAKGPATLYLHTSPEYAMKRLLADGFERIFQIARVFRNGEVAALHNPEFTMLEFYRAGADYGPIMDDLESALGDAAFAVSGTTQIRRGETTTDLARPFERVSYREVLLRETGIDPASCPDSATLRAAAAERGLGRFAKERERDDILFQLFLDHVEKKLGFDRATFVTEYPASMASLARLKPDEPEWAERFELYVAGIELANGFSELTDAGELLRRLVAEQELRAGIGRKAYPIDERFMEAVGRLPPCAGVAVGLDRFLMLSVGASTIDEVLLFPVSGFP